MSDNHRLLQGLNNLIDDTIRLTEPGEVTLNVELERTNERETLLHFNIKNTDICINKEQTESFI
ncbi:MAG: hypothetical protein AMR96_02255 [Candidatus Adiutrix intracellularis]|nr:MAG: hypothetical protein AMR96_02255 [Candidatus Adiutrix intracellularis]MDR2826640.1 hypothetical protein [Candidatus Adiutrix intracellularis]